MDISFYTAAVGAHEQQRRLDVHGNNIANVNNYGFKARRPSFQTLMTGLVKGIDEDLQRGVGSRLDSAEPDLRQSGVWGTERGLDYAIDGDGFFALMEPSTGEITYTRDGSFILMRMDGTEIPEDSVDLEPVTVGRWYLSDGLGRYVLSDMGRPIEVLDPMKQQEVGDPLPVGIFDFVNRNGFQSAGSNRFSPVEKNGDVGLGTGRLVQGVLEVSGTNLGYELSKVIESQRSFQYMLRMVQASDEITTTVNGLR